MRENEIEKNPYIVRALESLFQELVYLHRFDDVLKTARQYGFDLNRLLCDEFDQKVTGIFQEMSKTPDPLVEQFGFPPDDWRLQAQQALHEMANAILTDGLKK